MIFQVTGLPRSGTGFMTTVLNLHPECFAHHDIASERDDWKEYSDRLAITWTHVAEVNTYGWFPKATRQGPKVFIDRDPAAILQSMNEALDRLHDIRQFRNMRVDALFWAEANDALVVPFEFLFTLPVLEKVWGYLFNDYLFPVEKVAVLIKMNIQRHEPEKMLGSVEVARQRLIA